MPTNHAHMLCTRTDTDCVRYTHPPIHHTTGDQPHPQPPQERGGCDQLRLALHRGPQLRLGHLPELPEVRAAVMGIFVCGDGWGLASCGCVCVCKYLESFVYVHRRWVRLPCLDVCVHTSHLTHTNPRPQTTTPHIQDEQAQHLQGRLPGRLPKARFLLPVRCCRFHSLSRFRTDRLTRVFQPPVCCCRSVLLAHGG